MRVLFAILTFLALATPAHSETFRFPGLGFSFEGPAGWVILSGEEYRSAASTTDYGSDQLNEQIARKTGTPFLSLVKYPMPYPGVNPGIHLSKYPGRIVDITTAIENVMRAIASNTTGFTLIGGPELGVSGLFKSAHITYSYSAVSGGAVQYVIVETFTLVPMGDFYLTISAGTGPEVDEETRAEIRAATNSLYSIE